MRKMIMALLAAFIAYSSNAQLSNTKWKGSLNVQGGSMDVEFIFSNDTLDVINTSENESLETMKYTTTDSVLTLVKLYGQSQCDTTPGKYKYVIADNQMTINLISDDCLDRSGAMGAMKLDKEEVSQ